MVKLVNRARMSTSTTGTGTITLGSAENGYQSFDDAGVPDGDVVRYVIEDGANWEVGTGTYTASGTTLTRTVTESSNSDAAINLSGSAVVFIGPAAQDFSPTITLAGDASGSVTLTDLEDATLTVTVADDSHNHVIANVDGLQADLDAKLDKSGGTMTGNLILNADPTTALGAATKEYVDTIAAAGIHYHDPVRVEQEGNLTATYDNGSSGVGATLTNSGTQAALVIDGVTMVLNDRVLIYEQTNAFENGIYTVTNVGSASTNWVLTRATDADSYGASDPDALGQGDAFFVQEGNAGAGELYVMNTEGSITFGTTGITFTQIQSTAVYSGGTGITLSGTTFNLDSTISADTTGNAATATALETARTIGGVSFDGTANINLAGVNTTGNQDTTGNAATATAWETARTVTLSGDVSGTATGVDGSGNISITTTVADDSHAHVISNVDGLQTALDAKAPTASPTFSGTITFPAGQTFDGRDVSADGATLDAVATTYLPLSGGTLTGNLSFGDNDKAVFGAGSDLEIYHDGSNSIIKDAGTGTVKILASDFELLNDSGNYLSLKNDINGLGGINLYYVGNKKLSTTGSGITVTGNISVSGSVDGRDVAADGTKLDGIESGATADQTASEILTAVKTVDGSGSGLDADTVDGIQASSFLRSDAADSTSSTISFTGDIEVGDQIFHAGDTDTYMQFHAANQWRVVTGGTEMLEVNDTNIIASADLNINGDINAVDNIYVANSLYHEGDTDTGVSFSSNQVQIKAGSEQYTFNSVGLFFLSGGSIYENWDALSGTTPTCNLHNASAFSLTMSGNTTFTFSGATNTYSSGFVLQLTGNGGTVTWPSSVDWAGGTAPDAPASGETDLLVFWTRDGGTTWYGMLAIDAAA